MCMRLVFKAGTALQKTLDLNLFQQGFELPLPVKKNDLEKTIDIIENAVE